jgi:hypothetical protein
VAGTNWKALIDPGTHASTKLKVVVTVMDQKGNTVSNSYIVKGVFGIIAED